MFGRWAAAMSGEYDHPRQIYRERPKIGVLAAPKSMTVMLGGTLYLHWSPRFQPFKSCETMVVVQNVFDFLDRQRPLWAGIPHDEMRLALLARVNIVSVDGDDDAMDWGANGDTPDLGAGDNRIRVSVIKLGGRSRSHKPAARLANERRHSDDLEGMRPSD